MLHDNVVKWNKSEKENKDTYFYILTRFNLRWPGRYATEEDFVKFSESRIPEFDSLCVPGVASQTIKPNAWYVLFDSIFADREEQIKRTVGLDNFKPIFVPEAVDFGCVFEWFSTNILQGDAASHTYVMGMRLDSDDTISKYYISFLDDCLTYARTIKEPPLMFNFPYQLRIVDGKPHAYVATDSASAILWEAAKDPKTPYWASHTKLWEIFQSVECGTRFPMVAMHQHANNIGEYAWRDLIAIENGEEVVTQFFKYKR